MRYMCQPISPSDESGIQEGGKGARCEPYLKQWSGSEQKLIVASFYFWAIGEHSQASQEGLFRTLLLQLLQAHPDVIPSISPSRWESLCLFNEDTRPFTEDELGTMFQHAVAEISSRAKVALFIDGLDEFDGDCKVLINLLRKCVSYPIKVCVASRPWNEFSDAFQHNPSLRMEELTRHDIKKYVVATFGENPQFQRLQQRKANFAHDLIEQIVKKASGCSYGSLSLLPRCHPAWQMAIASRILRGYWITYRLSWRGSMRRSCAASKPDTWNTQHNTLG